MIILFTTYFRLTAARHLGKDSYYLQNILIGTLLFSTTFLTIPTNHIIMLLVSPYLWFVNYYVVDELLARVCGVGYSFIPIKLEVVSDYVSYMSPFSDCDS